MPDQKQPSRVQIDPGVPEAAPAVGVKALKGPWPPAVWRPTATVANSEITRSHSKHWTSPFSNRNKNCSSGFHLFSMASYHQAAEHFTTQSASSAGLHQGLSIRNSGKIEFAVTYTKQGIGYDSNRNYSRGPRKPFLHCFGSRRQKVHGATKSRGKICAGQDRLRSSHHIRRWVERDNVEETKFERPEWLDEVTGILETMNQGV